MDGHLDWQFRPPPSEGTLAEFVHRRDGTGTYDPGMIALAEEVARELELPRARGCYAAVLGPAYETPAEVGMLRRLGADLVGMSTVPEVLAARQHGLSVLALSLVTNRATGLE